MKEEIPHELAQNTCYVRCHPNRKFFHGRVIRGSGAKDLTWFRPDGKEMTDRDWKNSEVLWLGLQLAGDAIDEVDDQGNPIIDDTLLMLLNAHHEPLSYVLPAHGAGTQWELILDTRESTGKR